MDMVKRAKPPGQRMVKRVQASALAALTASATGDTTVALMRLEDRRLVLEGSADLLVMAGVAVAAAADRRRG